MAARDAVGFVLDHIIGVSIATIIAALSLALFFVWFFHRIFPEKPSTTAMASSVASLIFIVLIGYGLNNLFGLKRDRDARLFNLQQQHLAQLRPVLKLESDRLQGLANQFRTQGLLVENEIPITDATRISLETEPDVMSPDLRNHYYEYVSGKHELGERIATHDRNFEDAINLVEHESNFTNISWFTGRNLAITFLQKCEGITAGFVLTSSSGSYSFSHFGGGQSSGGGPAPVTVPADLLGAYKKYKRFKPSRDVQARCTALQESANYVAKTAQDLSKQALLLAQNTTLQGECDFVRLVTDPIRSSSMPFVTQSATPTVGDWAAIATAVATFFLAIVAAFQDKIRAWIMKPELKLSVRVAPPECQKTSWHFKTAAGIADKAPCYYFHVTVENSGNSEARDVEVFVASLTRRRADGQFERVDRFAPMNLLWAHFRQPFLGILSPKMPKMCDLAHVFHPNFANNFNHTLQGVAGLILAFDLMVEPNTKGYLVGSGVYRLKLVLGAANAKPKEYVLEINFQGQWHDDEDHMLSDGFGMTIV